ncbi:MAG: hypothetical protein IIB39_11135 [Candidatus Marinimicrobia bacterium]|nr:hypothetical protein [Candidatus Neomarinimicrobiota bacterium]
MNKFKKSAKILVVTGFVVAAIRCSGDGIGLNEFGDPVDSLSLNIVPVSLDSTLESIQENIFNAVCAVKCHKMPRPKKNLNLEQGQAYGNLVNVQSKELPKMLRVKPGDAESSYIIWKLEGRNGIRYKQMPLNLPQIPEVQIEAIKAWINNGAQE